MSYHLGIDVGNTYAGAALATATAVEVFHFSEHAVVMPATVYLRDDGVLAAGKAPENPVGSRLDRLGGAFMGRLGDPTPVIVGGKSYTVIDLLSILLRDVVEQVSRAQGEASEHIVLTHPASWGAFRRVLFEEAVRRAGLAKASLVTEPEAAATHYSEVRRWNDGDTVMVYDLGGDTFNATVLLKQSAGIYILGEPEHIEHLGGNEFDEAILAGVNDTIDGALSALDTTCWQNLIALARVRQECIRAKEALSAKTETVFPVLLPNQRFDVRLARSDFEAMVHGPIELTIDALSRTLDSAEVEPSDLSAVVLTGGSSRIPLVAQMVSAKLGCSVVVDPHPQHVVALGAAALAAQAARFDTSPHRGRQNDQQQRLANNGATTPTPTAKSVVAAAEQRGVPLHIPAQRSAAVIPAQRTPPRQATPAAAAPAIETSTVDPEVTTVQTPVLAVKPRPVQPRRPAKPPDSRCGEGKGGRSLRRESANRAAPPRALIGVGMAVTLTGSILFALFGGKSATQIPPLSAEARPSQTNTTAVTDLGGEAPIPAVAATIPLGQSATFVTVSPHGKHAYVANADAQTVTVVNTADNHVIATIPIVAGPPQFLAFAPDGRTLYVSVFNDQRTIHAIDVLDTGSNSVVATIPQPARPYLPAVSPDGKRLYVPNHDVAGVSVIDTATNAVIAQIPVAPNPHWVAFSPDGSRAYTANHESNLVSVIDTTTLKVLSTIPVGMSPHSVAVNPHRPLVANVNFDSASISVIDTITGTVIATIPVGQNPQDIVWAPDGRFAYAVNQGSNTISVIDSTTNQVTTTIPTGTGPTSIALVPNSRQAYVSNLNGKTLTVLDLAR
ncbi:MAG: Hsp70 family protein [Pseudonocardiales bacterium]|nr:Hsp70 family protein [Pseudonocardiales bacterium]